MTSKTEQILEKRNASLEKELAAKNRELEIEAALERVRARTMAMTRSEELSEASFLLDSEVRALGIETRGCAFNIYGEKESTEWFSSAQGTLPVYKTPREAVFLRYYEAGQRGETMLIEEFAEETCAAHYEYLCTLPIMGDALKEMIANGGSFPARQIDHVTYFKYGYLLFISLDQVPEAHNIFKRFAKVFEQTYTRFLDLQKAEAQAREAQIESALEKVRSRSLAMHHSTELEQVAGSLFDRLAELGLSFDGALILIFDKVNRNISLWIATNQLSAPVKIDLPYDKLMENNQIIKDFWHAIETGEHIINRHYTGETKNDYFRYVVKYNESKMPEPVRKLHIERENWTVHFVAEKNSIIGFDSWSGHITREEDFKILIRFAKVFEQAYTRFLDLQKVEAQAKEATKQASLDRVRGEIASMRSPEDLQRITPLVFNELTTLGVPFIRCGVFIIHEEDENVEVYLSTPDGHSLGVLNLAFDSNKLTTDSVAHWRQKKVYHQHWNKTKFMAWTKSMMKMGQVQNQKTYQGAEAPPESLDLHFIPFSQGMLYVGNITRLNDDEIDLVKSLAKAFSVAYARYEDFNRLELAKQSIENTLTELKATQSQLIQSEKMASLGELTAGIAHEIQNPLNFVNNFSEVSQELIDEMKEELANGNMEDVKEIMNDVIQNLEKINHHGKRADAIVKGMLQHSRSSSSTKEPTDINKLADEYLRLAYHGLRAKDKSFNAAMETDFDGSLPMVNVVPQDIGRVILNLITNAFYAAPLPPKGGVKEPDHKPTIWVSTKRISPLWGAQRGIEIRVKDNGPGIPKEILDKIFQPFFTTKPTGQGTGLGLSMSYDIVKAHGGELKVETKEGEGSEFIIQLPTV